MISLSNMADELGYNVDRVAGATIASLKIELARVAHAAHNEWIRLAKERLSTSQDLYVNALQQSQSFYSAPDMDSHTITLVGQMANNIESGMGSFDMKGVRPGWLGGSKAKTAADGSTYVVIPFRHSTTSKKMGYTGKAKDMGLKDQLKKVAKDYGMNRMQRTATGQVVKGITQKVPRSPTQARKTDVHRYLHNLTRIQAPVAGTTPSGKERGQAQLMTWRVMSTKSDPSSWIHPGIEAKNLLREVKNFAELELKKGIKNVLEVVA